MDRHVAPANQFATPAGVVPSSAPTGLWPILVDGFWGWTDVEPVWVPPVEEPGGMWFGGSWFGPPHFGGSWF